MWLYLVCGWNPSVWPFNWKLLSSVFKWYCLFLTILQNEIQDFSFSFELSTLGSERVQTSLRVKESSSNSSRLHFLLFLPQLEHKRPSFPVSRDSHQHGPPRAEGFNECQAGVIWSTEWDRRWTYWNTRTQDARYERNCQLLNWYWNCLTKS